MAHNPGTGLDQGVDQVLAAGGPLASKVSGELRAARPRWRGASPWVALVVTAAVAVSPRAALAQVQADQPVIRTEGPVVWTDEGLVRGVETPKVYKFLGIPFATPPVGELRWRPPQPAARWVGIRDASQFAPHCAQPAGWFIGTPSTNEDCLHLNVFVPRKALHDERGDRAVMVWIYGGGLTTGESDGYDPTALVVNGDVIVVSINYRLGALGFLAHPALTAESPHHVSGNYGIMDQQEALRWVKRNIRRFGGNPHRVTVFGESAGGLSVHAHLASPLAGGLFHRAIVQSGAYLLEPPTLAEAEAVGLEEAAAAGCPDQTAACLRALSVESVLASQGSANPVVDGFVLPRTFASALESGKFNRVPVLQGSTRDEGRQFVALNFELPFGPITPDLYPVFVAAILGLDEAGAAPLVAEYPADAYPTPGEALSALLTDGFFACPARRSELLLSTYVPTYAYEFNDTNAPQRFLPPVSFPYGAYHASEVQYLFDIPVIVPAPPLDSEQEELADAMVDYWTAFAKTGQPNAKGEPSWARFRSGSEKMLSLETPRRIVRRDFAANHNCTFWAALGF